MVIAAGLPLRCGGDGDLRDFVEFFSQRRVVGERVNLRIAPTARAEIIFSFGDPIYAGQDASTAEALPPAALLRPQAEPYTQIAGRVIDWFLVALTPLGCRRLLGASLSTLFEGNARLSFYWGECAADLHRRLAEEPSFEERVSMVSNALLEVIRPADGDLQIAQLAMTARSGTFTSVQAMADHANIGSRRFRERFMDEIGLTPKHWLSLARFNNALHVAHPDAWLSAPTNAPSAYFDQSHATREFKRFTGSTPGAYARRKGVRNDRLLVVLSEEPAE